MSRIWLGTCLVLCASFQLVSSDAFLSVKFLTFSNPRGVSATGRCCDEERGMCTSPCDHKFTVCLDQVDGSVRGVSKCTYKKFVTVEIHNMNYINFQGRIGNNPNPFMWRLPFWPGQVRLKIDVVDVDTQGRSDHVVYLQKEISLTPMVSSRGSLMTVGTNVKLTFEVRVYCGKHYYNLDCSVYCRPQDESGGHYLCEQNNGTKICLSGWTGPECGTSVDDCAGIRCQNGGQCLDLTRGFQCVCLPGYEGRFCEQEIDECLSSNLCHHGDCLNTPGSYTCTCLPGFTGKTCRDNINDCASFPCKNGALCIDHSGNFSCTCPAGFHGKLCEEDLNECEHGVCKNQGTCTNVVGTYHCHCLAGYHGYDCSVDVNECDSFPCQNTGSCVNHHGGYACQCSGGYGGKHCESDINECENTACKHGGVCTNLAGSFECRCLPFWTGKTCEHDVDECSPSPCLNGGSCVNGENGFVCFCSSNFTGNLCSIPVQDCNSTNSCAEFSSCLASEEFHCTCPKSFDQRKCEVYIRECEERRCLNGGKCVTEGSNSNCRCPANWMGERCQEDLDECASWVNPCHNNATCLNANGNFSCECSLGWAGLLCEADVDECLQSPDTCLESDESPYNGSASLINTTVAHVICLNTIGSYRCICENGWTGMSCTEDIDECRENPYLCSPDGDLANRNSFGSNNEQEVMILCANESPGYRCVCANGGSGQNCHLDSSSQPPSTAPGSSSDSATECQASSGFTNAETTSTTRLNQSIEDVTFSTSTAGSLHSNFPDVWPNLTVPFHLGCLFTAHNKSLIDTGLVKILQGADSFQGSSFGVSHTSKNWISKNGQAITSVMPIFVVDGRLLPQSDVEALLNKQSQHLDEFFGCPWVLDQTVSENISLSALSMSSSPTAWVPGFVSALVLAVVVAGLVLLFLCRRKIPACKTRTFKIESARTAKASRLESYKIKSGSLPKSTNNNSNPGGDSAFKMDLDDQSRTAACAQMAQTLFNLLDGGRSNQQNRKPDHSGRHDNNQEKSIQGVSTKVCLKHQQLFVPQDPSQRPKYMNLPSEKNKTDRRPTMSGHAYVSPSPQELPRSSEASTKSSAPLYRWCANNLSWKAPEYKMKVSNRPLAGIAERRSVSFEVKSDVKRQPLPSTPERRSISFGAKSGWREPSSVPAFGRRPAGSEATGEMRERPMPSGDDNAAIRLETSGEIRERPPVSYRRAVSLESENDKYRGLPYIDDPGYTEIITKDDQDKLSTVHYF